MARHVDERDLGAVDVLANVAGIGDPAAAGRITEITDERWNMVLAVNLNGPFFLCRALLPGMAERGRGAVVNVSSLAGKSKSATGGLSYSSSKAGLLGLTRHLAFDYGPRGVRVNALSPAGVFRGHDPGFVEKLSSRIPMERMAREGEYDGAIVFLASDASSFMTGHNLVVDGGRTIW